MKKPTRKIGLLLVSIGALFWGVGGTVSQKLFQDHAIEVDWLVSTRLTLAGLLLLLVQFLFKGRSQIFAVWKNKQTALKLVIFGIVGMLAVQYTYMASIDHGNAAVATLLQYTAPAMIIVYQVMRKQALLSRLDVLTVTLALAGCFLLLTNGSLSRLSVPAPAIIWGLFSGVALAFYTLYAVSLLKKYDSLVIVGWAMLIGGASLSFIHPPWRFDFAAVTLEGYLYLVFVIIFGTMLAFWFYIESLQSLPPKETSLLGSIEPLAAVFTTVIWLKEAFGPFQWLGAACIMFMIFLLALGKEAASKKKNKPLQAS